MRASASVLVLLGAVAFAIPVQADWHPGDDYKWVQLPDLSTTGVDVDVSDKSWQPEYNCADDFLCTVTCAITEIHFWGSWKLDDYPYTMSPDAVMITLTIHADVPAEESPTGYSIPGQRLWSRTFNQDEFAVEDWSTGTPEWWWSPLEQPLSPGDTNCWQYNFTIDPDDAFFQEGTPEEPVVYWLAVQVTPDDAQPAVKLGWKTSLDHWNDAAVWGLGEEPLIAPWNQLLYPALHPMTGERMDLAFVINGNPDTLDFGDALDPTYPTLLASDGARHTVVPGVHLGQLIDAEPDGQPGPTALGDDAAYLDDEDGVQYTTPVVPGTQAYLQVEASVPGYVTGWVDFNEDGDWDTAGDQVLNNVWVPAGVTELVTNTPATAEPNITTYGRFRFTTQEGELGYTGPADDGEVEDHIVAMSEGDVYDWGDAPAPYPTLAVDNGPSHRIAEGLCLGWAIDGELDGQPHPTANGDDTSNLPDEDGLYVNCSAYPGQIAMLSLRVKGIGYVSAWVDFDQDGDWDDATDCILFDHQMADGLNYFTFPIPETAAIGWTFARFRYTHCPGGLPYTGPAPDGEVMDERIYVHPWSDWGDAPDPYPTVEEDGGARHPVVPGIYLGQGIDQDVNGQPTWDALEDDRNGIDDEDGVRFLRPIIRGRDTEIEITASVDGYVSAYVDYNADGGWEEPNDQILNGAWVAAGTTAFTVPVPADAAEDVSTCARFRFTTDPHVLLPTGNAQDGEVEDYRIRLDRPFAFDTKWIQYPDLDPTGMGVSGSYGLTLADDFECTEPGRLAEIAVWGAWFNNCLPNGDPYDVRFVLSIYEDIPAWESPTGYSMPGELLWQHHYLPGDYDAEIWVPEVLGGWFDPSDGAYWFPGDSMCWLYSLHTPPSIAFHQTGMPEAPVVYWLSVAAYPFDTDAMWGWKTSIEHWNDDGVYAVAGDPWGELVYPSEHPLAGESVDLAFAVRNTYGTDVPEGGEPEEVIPERFGLRQNIPNPFNPVTTIEYDVPVGGGKVAIEVFDVSGRLVRTLVDGFVGEGVRTVAWDGRDTSGIEMGSGVYFCRMTAGPEEITIKMTLLE